MVGSPSWTVYIHLKNGTVVDYVYEGGKEEARTDAYLSFPRGDIQKVIVQEYQDEY